MVTLPWRRRPLTPDAVDRLIATAEELAMRDGATPAAVGAAGQAVDAARALAGSSGAGADRSRLLRALSRQMLNTAVADPPPGPVGPLAEEVVALARWLLAEAPAGSDAALRLAQAGQVLLSEAAGLLHRLGPAAADLRARAVGFAAALQQHAPALVQRAELRGAWPA